MAAFNFYSFCTPAQIYFVIAILSVVFTAYKKFNVVNLLVQSFIVMLLTLLLNWLCSKGLAVVSWIILLLPLFGMVAVMTRMSK